ncbi:MAG TPA: potassium transporter TrkG [Euzebya sp.]|nr:potassium transporter TrkG [Euzebya sp.]
MSLQFRPSARDVATVGFLVGRILVAVGVTMLVPAALGLVLGEVDAAAALLIGASTAVVIGCCGEIWLPRHHDVRWSDGMVAAGLSWLAAPLVGAIPLFLSGHFPQFLDAYFDAMSGFTTAGLSTVNDVDHLPNSINLWRHLMQFLGGQGLVLLALTFFAGGGGAVGMYAGEAREDKILPNVRRTAQFIWRASLVYFAFGATALWIALVHAGLDVGGAVFHAVNLFFAAFDTGGFSPRSASIGYYHSAAVEGVLVVLMVAGALSFAVHHVLWQGRGRELLLNIETRVLAATLSLAILMAAVGLARSGVYVEPVSLFRRGVFQVVSAHTGAGFSTIPGPLFATGGGCWLRARWCWR